MSDTPDPTAPRARSAGQAPDAPLAETPALEALLRQLRTRLRRQVWLHGIGTTATALAGWLVFAFLADWGLSVPRPVRLFHSVAVLAVLAFFLWRDLLRPLLRLPNRAELALLVEREHPDLRELLVSAVQLQRGAGSEAADELVRAVRPAADRRAGHVRTGSTIDSQGPRLRFASGISCAAVFALVLALRPLHGAIFLDRMLGGDRPWPQRTHLIVEIPLPGRRVRTQPGERELALQVARGSDVPVRVIAAGAVPPDVTLHFGSGAELVLASSGDGSFRTLLPSCREDVSFHVTGGDDRDAWPRISIQVLQPPDVSGVAVVTEPPAYTGLAPSVVFDRDVEVVAGSRVRVHVLPDPLDVSGVARVLPQDTVVPLQRSPFPSAAATPQDSQGAAPEPPEAFAFEWMCETSIRYRFELTDEKGLTNPDPGLFAIDVSADRDPQLHVLSPTSSRIFAVPGGAVGIRARAEDDYGLAGVGLEVRRADEMLIERALETQSLDGSARKGHVAYRLEIDELAAASGGPLSAGEVFELELFARDNREPDSQVGRSGARTVHLIATDELLRKVQDQLARARLDASELVDLQQEKRRRVEEILETLKSENPLFGEDAQALLSALAGQRRVAGDARALVRDLAGTTETVLYSRLDDKGGPLLEELDRRLAEARDAAFQVDTWRALVDAHRSGLAGAAGFAGPLVEMVGAALEVSEDHATAATATLDRAQAAVDAADVFELLLETQAQQDLTLEALEALLERLAEWDNFQSVLALTRDILGSQKTLRERTRKFAAEK